MHGVAVRAVAIARSKTMVGAAKTTDAVVAENRNATSLCVLRSRISHSPGRNQPRQYRGQKAPAKVRSNAVRARKAPAPKVAKRLIRARVAHAEVADLVRRLRPVLTVGVRGRVIRGAATAVGLVIRFRIDYPAAADRTR